IQRNYIVSFEFHPKTQRIAYPGLKEQFYFPFSIQFRDGDKWILQSSTSYPRERINGYHWNAEHIKMIDPAIKKAFVIYPDAMDIIETNRCLSYHQDIVKKKIISSLDGIISFADLYFMVEEKVLEHASTGKKKALQGTAFEEW